MPRGNWLVRQAPERLVWGSDWPHATQADIVNDASLVNLLHEWCDTEAAVRRILAENPVALYGFSA